MCVYVCVCVIYVYVCVCGHTCTHMRAYRCIYTCTHGTHTCHAYTRAHYAQTQTHHAHMRARHAHTHTHTHSHTHTHTHTQMHTSSPYNQAHTRTHTHTLCAHTSTSPHTRGYAHTHVRVQISTTAQQTLPARAQQVRDLSTAALAPWEASETEKECASASENAHTPRVSCTRHAGSRGAGDGQRTESVSSRLKFGSVSSPSRPPPPHLSTSDVHCRLGMRGHAGGQRVASQHERRVRCGRAPLAHPAACHSTA